MSLSAPRVAGRGDRGDGVAGEGSDRGRGEAEQLQDIQAFGSNEVQDIAKSKVTVQQFPIY